MFPYNSLTPFKGVEANLTNNNKSMMFISHATKDDGFVKKLH